MYNVLNEIEKKRKEGQYKLPKKNIANKQLKNERMKNEKNEMKEIKKANTRH